MSSVRSKPGLIQTIMAGSKEELIGQLLELYIRSRDATDSADVDMKLIEQLYTEL